mgnify:CR=1 FL=1|jgi:hypothetical protein
MGSATIDHTAKMGKVQLTGPRLDSAIALIEQIRVHRRQITRLESALEQLHHDERRDRDRPDRTALAEMMIAARPRARDWNHAAELVAARAELAPDIVQAAYQQYRREQKDATTRRQWAEVERRYRLGQSMTAIASQTGYSRAWVSEIIRRQIGPKRAV